MDLAGWIERSAEGRRTVASPVELDDEASLRADWSVLVYGAALVAVVILWAALVPIRELAVAPGNIIPAAEIRTVQHLEGGVVSAILATPGTRVATGDPILKLEPAAAEADFGQLNARRGALVARRDQLNALLARDELRSSEPTRLEPTQRQVYSDRLNKADADRRVLEARIAQRKAEIAALEREVAATGRLVTVQEEQVRIRSELLPKGYVSKREMLESEAALETARMQVSSAVGRLDAAKQSLTETEQSLVSTVADSRQRWSEELSTVEAELAETEQALSKHVERVARLVVRAPVDGTVMEIVPKSDGDVVGPGEVVARVVPDDGALIAEVQLRPEDVGEVAVGDEADIQVTTFDPNVYGKLTGVVEEVSPSTFFTAEGLPYFRARLALDRAGLGDEEHPRPLRSGMTVQAHIVTGEKSLMRYLLKPIYRNFGLAFSEK